MGSLGSGLIGYAGGLTGAQGNNNYFSIQQSGFGQYTAATTTSGWVTLGYTPTKTEPPKPARAIEALQQEVDGWLA